MKRLLAFDASLSQRLTLSPRSIWWRWARIVAHLGDGPYVFTGLGLIYLLGWPWPNPLVRQAALVVMVVVFLAMATVTAIKFLIRRPRPQPPGEFVTFQYDKYSFPSGHSARMMALSVGIFFFYPIVGWILLILATSVAVARVVVGIHYVSDIMIGIGVGALVGWVATWLLLSVI